MTEEEIDLTIGEQSAHFVISPTSMNVTYAAEFKLEIDEAKLEEYFEEKDAEEAQRRLDDPDEETIPWSQAKRELGL